MNQLYLRTALTMLVDSRKENRTLLLLERLSVTGYSLCGLTHLYVPS